MAQQLEKLLAEETRAGKEAEAELLAREEEKAKLLVLLKHKDRRLRQELLSSGRLRRALHNAKSSAGYYMLLCALRSWRDLSKRKKSQRKVERAKVSYQEALLRFSCRMMAAQLRRASAKPLAEAMHRLRLNSTPTAEPQDLSSRQTKHAGGKDRLLLVPVSIRTQVPEDEVLWGTPRKPLLEVKSPSSTPPGNAWKNNFHLRSPFSEASTRATSSSCPKASLAACAAAARLAIVFNRATLRCSANAWRKLRANAPVALPEADSDLWKWNEPCTRLQDVAKRLEAVPGEKHEQREVRHRAWQSALDAEEWRARSRTVAHPEKASKAMNGSAAEPSLKVKGAKNQQSMSSTVREELQSLRVKVNEARRVATEPVHLGQEAFLDLQAAWQRERDEWFAACDKLRCQTLAAQGEAEAARLTEAEAAAAARARQQAEPNQVEEDRLHLRQLQSQLQQLIHAAKVTGELEVKAAKALSEAASEREELPGLPDGLDEVLAYQTLVARLRSELRWEKERRQSCDQALETLRGSYGLLLSRALRVQK